MHRLDLDAASLVGVAPELLRHDIELPVKLAVPGPVVREGVLGESELEVE